MQVPQERIYTSEDYWNLPEGQRAELIDGKLYAMAPPNRIHQRLVSRLTQIIGSFIDSNKGTCEVYPAPFAVNLNADDKVWVEPDISVICDRNKLDKHGCKGAPDLIAEVLSPSTQRHDQLVKLNLYQRAGVKEYWIADPAKKQVTVYSFEQESMMEYLFTDEIPVGIYEGFSIKIEQE